MSSFGQRVALWPDLPHEKHITSDQSRWTGRCLNSCLGIRSLFWKVGNFDPNLFSSCVSGQAGFIAAILSLKRSAILSNIDGSGAFVIVLTPRLSISTSLLSSALVSSTERSGLFTVPARTVSGSLLQISLTTDGLISTTGHSRRRYI